MGINLYTVNLPVKRYIVLIIYQEIRGKTLSWCDCLDVKSIPHVACVNDVFRGVTCKGLTYSITMILFFLLVRGPMSGARGPGFQSCPQPLCSFLRQDTCHFNLQYTLGGIEL